MRLFYFAISCLIFLSACSGNHEKAEAGSVSSVVATPGDSVPFFEQETTFPVTSSAADSASGMVTPSVTPVYSYETFMPGDVQGWGYRILMDGQLYISQPHIPAVQGNKGFSTQADAVKTAELAIFKIKQGFMPPTITVKELDSLGVLK